MLHTNIAYSDLVGSFYDLIPKRITGAYHCDDIVNILTDILLSGRKSASKFTGEFRDARFEINEMPEDHIVIASSTPNSFESAKNCVLECLDSSMFTHGKQEETIELYAKQQAKLNTIVLRDEERRRAFVLIEKCDVTSWHVFWTAFKTILSWYFVDEPLTKDEKNLLRSLLEDDTKHFVEMARSKYDLASLRDKVIDAIFGDYEKKYVSHRIDVLRNKIQKSDREIKSIKSQIGEYMQSLRDFEMERREQLSAIFELENTRDVIETGSLANYIKRNKKINIVDSNDESVLFSVNGFVSNWDEDYIERLIRNKDCYLYKYAPNDNAEILLKGIFINEDVRLGISGAYKYYYGSIVSGTDDYKCYKSEYHLPNGHIFDYQCLGGYNSIISDAIFDGDDQRVFEACVASAESMDFTDDTACRPTIARLFGEYYERPVLEIRETKERISPCDYIARVKAVRGENQ